MTYFNLLATVGWNGPVPIHQFFFVLRLFFDYQQSNTEVPRWIFIIVAFVVLAINIALHHLFDTFRKGKHNCWRSNLRSCISFALCISLWIQFLDQTMNSFLVPFSFNILALMLSVMFAFAPPINQWLQTINGIWNWLAFVFALWLLLSNHTSKTASSPEGNLYLLLLGIDFMASPSASLAWQVLIFVAFSVVIMICDDVHWPTNYDVPLQWFVVISISCAMLSNQCYIIKTPVRELLELSEKMAKNKRKQLSIQNFIVFLFITTCTLGLNAAYFQSLQHALLIAHFAIHMIAHVSCAYAMLIPEHKIATAKTTQQALLSNVYFKPNHSK